MTDETTKQRISTVLQKKIDGAQSGEFLAIHFSQIAQQARIDEDDLEKMLGNMCREGSVIRVGHQDIKQDCFTLPQNLRTPKAV